MQPGNPLKPGTRVSLELPESGTCVGVVKNSKHNKVALQLLDEVPDGELPGTGTLDMFMPSPQGIYHWLCAMRSPPKGQRARVELLGEPSVVQRRLGQRLESYAQAQVRRMRSGRRGPAQPTIVVNLSRGGMKLQGPLHATTGDTVETVVLLDKRVILLGRVVMTYPLAEGTWATHVNFLPGQREALDALDSYLARRFREGSH